MAFVDFERLRADRETFTVVAVPEWGGDVRINKLTALELLPLLEIQGDEEGPMSDDTAIEFAVAFVAATAADESGALRFDSDEGRAFLATEYAALRRLSREARALHNLDANGDAKKNS